MKETVRICLAAILMTKWQGLLRTNLCDSLWLEEEEFLHSALLSIMPELAGKVEQQ